MNRLAKKALRLGFAVLLTAGAAAAQSGVPNTSAGAAGFPAANSVPLSSQNPLSGSVSAGKATAGVLPLSLADAMDRGLRQNLSLLLSNDALLSSQGQLVQQRSPLLPSFSAGATEDTSKVNLTEQGFEKIASRFPGFPLLVGPFGYFDLRAYFSQSLVDFSAWDNEHAARRNLDAAKLSYRDARELVALVVAATYLQTIAQAARVDSAQAQLQTAQALYDQAVDLKKVGASAGIDLLRAQVQLQTYQQQLIAARNNLEKQKLILARTIGLPLGQAFRLTDDAPYESVPTPALEDVLARAFASRADLQSALVRERAAEYVRRAATAEHLPTLAAVANYGVVGPTPNRLNGSYSAAATLNIPIFSGNRSKGDALVSQAALDRVRQQIDDLRGQIEEEVRAVFLDLQSDSDQVNVARSNVDLAQQTLVQARDRFSAGATDNIEVVQAQQLVAAATDSYISSLYAYNLARVQLARATGSAEQDIRQYWKEK